MKRRFFGGLVVLALISDAAIAETPIFSFWGNLLRGKQVQDNTLIYRKDLTPLTAEKATTCCDVRPGQALTLVRNGEVVGVGKVGAIIAGDIPLAGENRMVFFRAEGFPDSIQFPKIPAGASYGKPSYDLYIVGDSPVRVLKPPVSPWPDDVDLTRVVTELLREKVIWPADFMYLAPPEQRTPFSMPEPSVAASWMREGLRLSELSVTIDDGIDVDIQTCQRRASPFGPFFIRLVCEVWGEPEYLRGKLDLILQVNNQVYLVLRNSAPESGGWFYGVYQLFEDKGPELVHADGSWST